LLWISNCCFVLVAFGCVFYACVDHVSHLLLTCSLCIDAFSLGHPRIILFRHVQILINLSSTMSGECISSLTWLKIKATWCFDAKFLYVDLLEHLARP
jgi:hypothetical protein